MVRTVVAGTLFDGLENQHGIRLMVDTQTGLVRKRRVRAETVIAVVRTDLQRACGQNQALAGECLRNLGAALGCVIGYALAGVAAVLGLGPVLSDEFSKRRCFGGAAVISLLSFGALLIVLSHVLIISPSPQAGVYSGDLD